MYELTKYEFEAHSGLEPNGLRVVQLDNCEAVAVWGHVGRELFNTAAGIDVDEEPEHTWAVATQPAPDWYIKWGDQYKGHPFAFPITVVSW